MDSLTTALILFFSTFLAGTVFIFLPFKKEKSLKIILSFSGAFLFGLTILHFMPEITRDYKHTYGLFVLIGFTLQIILEFLTQGIDHGHYHKGHNHGVGITALIGLFLHALFEATPLAQGHGHDHGGFHAHFLGGLILHKLPVAIVFGTMLAQYLKKKVNAVLLMGLFALMAPLGLAISESVEVLRNLHEYFMAFVIGIFLYISTTILFEINENHSFNAVKLASIIGGFGIAFLISYL